MSEKLILKPDTIAIDSTDIWLNKDFDGSLPGIKFGVLGVDWSGSHGFGRWEMILDENGIPHIYTECMDKDQSKEFSKAILQNILDKAIIEE